MPKAKLKKKSTSKPTSFHLQKLLVDNLFYVSLYSFCFMVLITVFLGADPSTIKNTQVLGSTTHPFVLAAESETTHVVPTLRVSPDLSFPILSAQGVVVVDVQSDLTLFEKDPNTTLLPASTVKMMTALIVLENMPEDKVITVGAVTVPGQKMGLFTGEQLTVGNLLEGMLVYSANDAAEVLAQNYPGGEVEFINAMNYKVKALGLQSTQFSNATGLDGYEQVTTANDLATIAQYAMTNPRFAEIVRKSHVDVVDLSGNHVHRLNSTNKLLGSVEGVYGVKTGWTENARENLVTYVERDGKQLMITVLGSQDRFGETKEIIEWIFDHYEWKTMSLASN